MHGRAVPLDRSAPSASAVAALLVDERDHDAALVAFPRPEIHLVVRFGPGARDGIDAHAFGVHSTARRKTIRANQRAITARLQLGATEAVLGVPASALAGRIVALEDLWGDAAAHDLLARLAAARTTREAAALVERAIADRVAAAPAPRPSLALAAAAKLATAPVKDVAVELGMSERHFRRLFRDATGVGPKTFAKLARFHRALGAARQRRPASWASIAAASGYYDQAHLIDEFRAIAGVTPSALLAELGGDYSSSVGATRLDASL